MAIACNRHFKPVVVALEGVQLFPCLALPLMFLLLPPKHTGMHYWIVAAAFYARS